MQSGLQLRQSGVLGPLTAIAADGSVIVWCRTLHAGTVLLEIALSASFVPVQLALQQTVEQIYGASCTFTLDSLSKSTQYHVRVAMAGMDWHPSNQSAFYTVPGRSGAERTTLRATGGFAIDHDLADPPIEMPILPPAPANPWHVCALGNPLAVISEVVNSTLDAQAQLRYCEKCCTRAHVRNPALRTQGILRGASLCIAWEDSSKGADDAFKAEEVCSAWLTAISDVDRVDDSRPRPRPRPWSPTGNL